MLSLFTLSMASSTALLYIFSASLILVAVAARLSRIEVFISLSLGITSSLILLRV